MVGASSPDADADVARRARSVCLGGPLVGCDERPLSRIVRSRASRARSRSRSTSPRPESACCRRGVLAGCIGPTRSAGGLFFAEALKWPPATWSVRSLRPTNWPVAARPGSPPCTVSLMFVGASGCRGASTRARALCGRGLSPAPPGTRCNRSASAPACAPGEAARSGLWEEADCGLERWRLVLKMGAALLAPEGRLGGSAMRLTHSTAKSSSPPPSSACAPDRRRSPRCCCCWRSGESGRSSCARMSVVDSRTLPSCTPSSSSPSPSSEASLATSVSQ
mmetsp:Transcript_31413/g.77695  ORF Transcript_31413/g.77695 Transcript_31413/m.77695 type:complete len:279 (+) Transcript_31413:132-968(+)